jgi:hypothetical protein
MTTLQIEEPIATHVAIVDGSLVVNLADGRTVTVPLSWYPRVFQGTPQERSNMIIQGNGLGVHWPELDEDISIEGIIAGRPSKESSTSLKRWLLSRKEAD